MSVAIAFLIMYAMMSLKPETLTMQGGWKRIDCSRSKDLIGMQLYVDNTRAIITTPAEGEPYGFKVGVIKWKDIEPTGLNEYKGFDMYRGYTVGYHPFTIKQTHHDTLRTFDDSGMWKIFIRVELLGDNFDL